MLRPLRNKDFLLLQSCCSFSSDSAALLIRFRTAWTSPSLSRDLFFAEVVALFSLGPYCFAFHCLRQHIAKSFTQKLPLGKGSGYVVSEFCDAYAIRGTCPQEGATHFSGHIYSRRQSYQRFKTVTVTVVHFHRFYGVYTLTISTRHLRLTPPNHQ